MKTNFLTLLFFAIIFVTNAQSYDLSYILKQIDEKTTLTDDQKMKIAALSQDYYPKAMALQNSKESNEKKAVKAMALKVELNGGLKNILTKEQYQLYEEKCAEVEKKYIR